LNGFSSGSSSGSGSLTTNFICHKCIPLSRKFLKKFKKGCTTASLDPDPAPAPDD
jgi:hypothetical protein